MKTRYLRAMILTVSTIVIFGCQSAGSYFQKGFVPPEQRISITQPQQTGLWKGDDLTVDYRLTRSGSQVDISGAINFADTIVYTYSVLHDFRLSVIFVDENGKALGSQGIVTERGDFSSIPFKAKLAPPLATSFIAFSYQGTAIEGGNEGGGGVNYFWHYPIR